MKVRDGHVSERGEYIEMALAAKGLTTRFGIAFTSRRGPMLSDEILSWSKRLQLR